MKRNVTINFVLGFIIFITSFFIFPQNTNAAEKTTQINKLLRKMDSYECTVLAGERVKINLTKTEMAKAAALSIRISEKDGIDISEFGGFNTFKISNKKLQKASQNLFGLKLSTKNLKKKRLRMAFLMRIENQMGLRLFTYLMGRRNVIMLCMR